MLQAALQEQCPLPTGPGRVGVPRCRRRAPLPLSQGDTTEQGCPLLARNFPLLAYFVGGSRAAKPFVAASCVIQRLVAGKQASPPPPSRFQLVVKPLHCTQAPRNSLGPRLPCCCAKQCPGSHRMKWQHTASPIPPLAQNFL